MSPSPTRDPELWRRLWLEAKERSPVNRRKGPGAQPEIEQWNLRAPSFAAHSDSEGSRARRRGILSWLKKEGALRPEASVLDIGAGPGSFALPLSRASASVVALEPAEAMASILERKIEERGIENIRVIRSTWEETDLAAESWIGAFDLVFASMSPGVSHPAMLEKMNSASRAFCYLSGWSGGRWGKWGRAQCELWPLIFREELGDYPSDIFYAFGLLYALGYRPELRFLRSPVLLEAKAEEAIGELVEHFSRYVEVGEAVRGRITAYVQSHSRKGTFRQESTLCQGFMLWPVENRESLF
jgi:SAM-dependent methyltransferase